MSDISEDIVTSDCSEDSVVDTTAESSFDIVTSKKAVKENGVSKKKFLDSTDESDSDSTDETDSESDEIVDKKTMKYFTGDHKSKAEQSESSDETELEDELSETAVADESRDKQAYRTDETKLKVKQSENATADRKSTNKQDKSSYDTESEDDEFDNDKSVVYKKHRTIAIIDSDSEASCESVVEQSDGEEEKEHQVPVNALATTTTKSVSRLSVNSATANRKSTNKQVKSSYDTESEDDKFDNDESVIYKKHRKIATIDSDSDSSSESVVEQSDNEEERQHRIPAKAFADATVSRLSANFGALNKDLCSTRIGDLKAVNEATTLLDTIAGSSVDVVDVSSDEEAARAQNLFSMPATVLKATPRKFPIKSETNTMKFPLKTEPNTMLNYVKVDPAETKPKIDENVVSRETYGEQQQLIQKFEADLTKLSSVYKTVNVAGLPDKGALLRARQDSIKGSLKLARLKLATMVVSDKVVPTQNQRKPITWDDIKVESDTVQPKTLGQKALQTYTEQKTVTMERLEQLHGSLSTCPKEDTLAVDPKNLKCELMKHQKHALAWLMWREKQQPSGGILADDMGLGKTLTMISLMLKSKEEKPDRPGKENVNRKDHLYEGGTLIVCPASLLQQWEAEVRKHCKRGLASVELYHGAKRETKGKNLARYDMVVTTYTICTVENDKPSSPLYRVRWRRIILDEGHQIRNHKSRMCVATCNLEGQSRWILTGTPIHNKEMDMYALMKFLRCSPFDDYGIWKRWISNKDTGGYQRLQTVIASLMLRRTKAQLQERGELEALPERTWKIVEIKLENEELEVYQKVMFFSRTLFAQYLHQKANKGDYEELTSRPAMTKANDVNSQYIKIYEKLMAKNQVKEVKAHEILMILLRLRQACCHPTLITQFLEREEFADDQEAAEINLMEELEKLNLNDDDTTQIEDDNNVASASKKVMNMENPVFAKEHRSSKIVSILELVKDIVWERNEKAIIVSQWTSFLRLIGHHLTEDKIEFTQLDGSVNVQKRMEMVHALNDRSHPTKVLLLSLTAGGVGLNLVGANHLLLIDIHWNPQLELQAQDRIYRVGQERPVFIYKFVTVDTIEQRVKQLQDYKLSIADSMLTGAKPQQTQLSLQDLRMLFNM